MAFPNGWGRKQQITIDHTQVSGSSDLSDFTVLITLDHLDDEVVDAGANSALNGGGDIRFSVDDAGLTLLPCEIVELVTSVTPSLRRCQIWVKIPTVYYNQNTDLYIWYNKAGETQPAVTSAYGRNAVFSGEEAVYAFNDNASTQIDLTGNGHDLSLVGTVTTDSTHKAFGSSSTNLGGTAHFTSPTDLFKGQSNLSFRGWIRNSGTSSYGIMGAWDDNTNMSVLLFTGSNDKLYMRGRNSTTYDDAISATLIQNQAGTPWHHVSATYDNTDLVVYVDGVLEGTTTLTGSINNSATQTFEVGRYNSSNGTRWSGNFQFFKVSHDTKSADWIATEYANQNDPATFASAGIPEAAGGGAPILAVSDNAHTQVADQAVLNQTHILQSAFSTHEHHTDDVSFLVNNAVIIHQILHGHAADQILLTQHHDLQPEDGLHTHFSTRASLATGNILAIFDALHPHQADVTNLAHFQDIFPADAVHDHFPELAGLFTGAISTPSARTLLASKPLNSQIPQTSQSLKTEN